MANAATLLGTTSARLMIAGYPGTAKTGSLCSLANAGYKLRVLSFDKAANMQSLLRFTKPEFLPNIDILFFEDKLRQGMHAVEVSGVPSAFPDAFKAMDHWVSEDAEGNKVDLGRSRDWGSDTIVVLDSLSEMGSAAKRRAMHLANKTSMTDAVYGAAMEEQMAFLSRLCSSKNRHHVIVITHIKMISPKDFRKGESDIAAKLKEAIAEQGLIPTKLFPNALGQVNPQEVGGLFGTGLLRAETEYRNNKARRILRTSPLAEMDLKMVADVPDVLPAETGLLTIFEALGYSPEGAAVSLSGAEGGPQGATEADKAT